MYGDSQLIRRRVDQLRAQGEDVRALAEQLVSRTDALAWTGRAAAGMRERATERARGLRGIADRHASAATALETHRSRVDAAKEQIVTIERRAARLVEEARGRTTALAEASESDGIRREPDPRDARLLAFVPPPPGHKNWLTVDLPEL